GDQASVARSDFIRTQLRRASLPPSDPRQCELQARELRLAKRWAAVWCGGHYFRKGTFRRGVVDTVHPHLQHFPHHPRATPPPRQMRRLEPVREVRLTGWRGSRKDLPDLVRRVAACEEWQLLQKLEIHHQGPHRDPGNDVLTLLESPHLSGLRGLLCPRMALD